MNEATWLRDYAVRGDAEAFAQIVSRYEGMVFATCRRRLHDVAEVEDAVQETFLRLARKAGELRSNLGGWLHSCAVNVANDLNRRRASRLRRENAAARPEGSEDNPAESQEMLAELRGQLDAAMEKLDPALRELLIQRYFVGRAQAQLAAEAGLAPSTIAHRLEQAVEALRRHLRTGKGGAAMAIGAGVLLEALEAETAAAASVPAALTANVMKIGLSGVGSAAAGPLASIALKAACGIAAAMVVGFALWFFLVRSSGAPATVATESAGKPVENAAEVPSAPQGNVGEYPGTRTNNQPTVTVEVQVWSAEAVPLTEVIPRLMDAVGKEVEPVNNRLPRRFVVPPGHYRATVERAKGQSQGQDIDLGAEPTEAGKVRQIVIVLQ